MMLTDQPGDYSLKDTVDVPPEWDRLDLSGISGPIMIVGASDTGKTALFRYLVNRFSAMHGQVLAIDADPGQGRLSPPTMISLGHIKTSDGRQVIRHIWHRFVGSTTPSGHMLQVVTGCARLAEKAREIGTGPIVMDTSGLVDPQKGGLRLKFAKIDMLRPSVLIVLQRAQELETLIRPLQICRRMTIIDMKCVSAVRRREFDERQAFREESFRRYFRNGMVQHFFWTRYGVFPYPRYYLDRLLGLEDREGFTLGLGIIKKFDPSSKTVSVFTPLGLDDLFRINGIQVGDVTIDPWTFKHDLIHPA